MPRILYCASTVSHIVNFHIPYLQYFKQQGFKVDVVVGDSGDSVHLPFTDRVIALPIEKRQISISNFRAVYAVHQLLTEEHYDLITVHTTLAGAVVRLGVSLTRNRVFKVAYTSHGYFFSKKDAMWRKPYLYLERMLAPVTDLLLVMNDEDLQIAKRYQLGKVVELIPGMGVDSRRFYENTGVDKGALKNQAGYRERDFLIACVAEMSARKNQGELIRAFAQVALKDPSVRLLLAGTGGMQRYYMEVAVENGVADRVSFLGHVRDVATLYQTCDLVVSTSRSEGLPFNVMEAMCSGVPVIASKIKGHVDLLRHVQDACLYNLGDESDLAERLWKFRTQPQLRAYVVRENLRDVKPYCLADAQSHIIRAYSTLI
ncbi:glycosyltransferase [Alicyclobacillus mengziensis]|uniref:Glycosyltransferase n=1 Tax=Alicyclobacillus mengziensis TaxID=2931921 RepID=A0A9X7VZM0_9BACL|nr:glycosyltransferase [Alicyclobacillus mengziensis]QSO47535.1 glycosyltransferase [Alicyclobacillus mengziensis]